MTLFIITGASGSGKTSLSGRVASQRYWVECKSHTTRSPRVGEADGETYYFITKEKCKEMLNNDEFAEFVEYDGNNYGISKEEIKDKMKQSKHVFIIAEYNGYKQLKKLYPDAVGIFINSTKEQCMANMLLRGDSLEKATKRINTYDEEVSHKGEFDYVVKNVRDKSKYSVDILCNIINQYN